MDNDILKLAPGSVPQPVRAEALISTGEFANADAVRRGAKQ